MSSPVGSAAPALSLGTDARQSSRRACLAAAVSVPVLTTVTVVGIAALAGAVGADARWLAALGGFITSHGSIPTGVPFAAAPTAHWHNAIVLAELVFHGLEAWLGDRGLVLAQLIAVALTVIVLFRDARATGASEKGAGAAVLIAAVGAAPALVVARVQLFSLILFVLLMALLRAQARRPSWQIWLALPLIALWSNLHGAVLIGAGVAFAYLAVDRLRRDRWTAIGVAAGVFVALCATPAGISTLDYYMGLLTNEAAAQGAGLWGPLSLTAPLDVVLVLAAIVLGVQLWRAKPALWELVVAVALAIATVKASRSGVWLVFFLAVPAARAFRTVKLWDWVMPPVATLALVGLVVGIARGPVVNGAGNALLTRAISLANGTPIVADDLIDEQVALAGGRIWVGNPIDAFSKADQSTYLNWLAGRRSGLPALGPDIRVVLTGRNTDAERLMAGDPQFQQAGSDKRADLFVRVSGH
jgi:hypothetical protein